MRTAKAAPHPRRLLSVSPTPLSFLGPKSPQGYADTSPTSGRTQSPTQGCSAKSVSAPASFYESTCAGESCESGRCLFSQDELQLGLFFFFFGPGLLGPWKLSEEVRRLSERFWQNSGGFSAQKCPCPNVFGQIPAFTSQISPGEPLALISGVLVYCAEAGLAYVTHYCLRGARPLPWRCFAIYDHFAPWRENPETLPHCWGGRGEPYPRLSLRLEPTSGYRSGVHVCYYHCSCVGTWQEYTIPAYLIVISPRSSVAVRCKAIGRFSKKQWLFWFIRDM